MPSGDLKQVSVRETEQTMLLTWRFAGTRPAEYSIDFYFKTGADGGWVEVQSYADAGNTITIDHNGTSTKLNSSGIPHRYGARDLGGHLNEMASAVVVSLPRASFPELQGKFSWYGSALLGGGDVFPTTDNCPSFDRISSGPHKYMMFEQGRSISGDGDEAAPPTTRTPGEPRPTPAGASTSTPNAPPSSDPPRQECVGDLTALALQQVAQIQTWDALESGLANNPCAGPPRAALEVLWSNNGPFTLQGLNDAEATAMALGPSVMSSGWSGQTLSTELRQQYRIDVVQVQYLLDKDDYGPLTIDGHYGPLTEAAVKHYQTDHGIDAVGFVGPGTWSSLVQSLGSSEQAERDAVKAVCGADVVSRSSSGSDGYGLDRWTYVKDGQHIAALASFDSAGRAAHAESCGRPTNGVDVQRLHQMVRSRAATGWRIVPTGVSCVAPMGYAYPIDQASAGPTPGACAVEAGSSGGTSTAFYRITNQPPFIRISLAA
jgi:hypothetical protein